LMDKDTAAAPIDDDAAATLGRFDHEMWRTDGQGYRGR
jgi:hypothetical protein